MLLASKFRPSVIHLYKRYRFVGMYQQIQRHFRMSMALNRRGPNFYQVLEVQPSASEKEIKTSYYKMAQKYHPDHNPDDEEARKKFDVIAKAYETLSDPALRDEYDGNNDLGSASMSQFEKGMSRARARAAAYSDDEYEDLSRFQRRPRAGGGPRRRRGTKGEQDDDEEAYTGPDERQFWEEADRAHEEGRDGTRKRQDDGKQEFEKKTFDDFDDFFNFTQDYDASRDDTKGADYKTDASMNFLDAINGTDLEIELNKRVVCKSCNGRRADLSKKPRPCFECGSRGSVIGNYGIRKKCQKCDGSGCQVKVDCKECEGLGVTRRNITENIYLPKGIKDGQKLRLPMQGHASDCYGSPAGDLLLTVQVIEHENFTREGQEVYSNISVTLSQAILGTKLCIATVDGKINIEVPAGTQDGDQLTLKHYGAWAFDPPDTEDPVKLRGGHIITFKVVMPKNLTDTQIEILKKYAEMEQSKRSILYQGQTIEENLNSK